MSKVLWERGFGSLPSSTETNPRYQVKSISTTVEADSYLIRRIGKPQYAVSTRQNHTLMDHMDHNSRKLTLKLHIDNSIPRKEKDPRSFTLPCFIKILYNLDMPEDIKVPLIFERPFLSTAHAKIDVCKRKITLRVGEERIIFTSVKPASSLIKRVYMLSLRERMELDLEARLMGETLVLNRSLDPVCEDYIELNDLNKPIELKRNQGNKLMPTIEEGEVVEKFRAKNDARKDSKVFRYPSDCDHDKKIHIDCAYNLKSVRMDGIRVEDELKEYNGPQHEIETQNKVTKLFPLLDETNAIMYASYELELQLEKGLEHPTISRFHDGRALVNRSANWYSVLIKNSSTIPFFDLLFDEVVAYIDVLGERMLVRIARDSYGCL
nr:hypothetical protein [Tanacetum cinerariifolium]